jgi:hypothetical protein
MVVDYSKGKIYKLVSPSGLIYVGSTCEPTIAIRKAKHKSNFKGWKNGKSNFVTSFKLFEEDEDNVVIVLIEEFPCENKMQLHKQERFYIETLDCVNKIIVGRTYKEYYIDNKDKLKQYSEQYRENNKDKSKEYRENNKDKSKKYRENNKDVLKAKRNAEIQCDCGITYTRVNKTRHEKSNKHQNFIKNGMDEICIIFKP